MTQEKLNLAKKYYYLGRLFYFGTENVDASLETSMEYYEKSAELGYSPAIFQMGISYYYGWRDEYCTPDYGKALEFFIRADSDDGNFFIGECYYFGHGVKKNYERAISVYEKLAKKNYTRAAMRLGHMYRDGIGVERNVEKAIEYYSFAGERGNSAGCLYLAKMYLYGNYGVEVDKALGDRWLKLWARYDVDEDAVFYRERDPEEYDEAMAFFEKLADGGDMECAGILVKEKRRKND